MHDDPIDMDALDDETFRLQFRNWLNEYYPDEWRRPIIKRLQGEDEQRWYHLLSEHGWRLPAWPKKYGGMGLSLSKQLIYTEELDKFGAARFLDFGGALLGPVLMKYGSAAQKARYLPEIARGDALWCQGYSEPNAGSDLASLKTTAIRDGDHYVLNGTKIWTTMVQFSKRMFVLVRTSQENIKQKGISFLLLDMDTPGISFRPIENLAGDVEFGQVFFDDARVPVENLVHDEGSGWTVAKALLGGERIHTGSPNLPRHALDIFDRVLEHRGLGNDTAWATKRAELWADLNDLTAFYGCMVDAVIAGTAEPQDFSVLKVFSTELFQRMSEAMLDAAGEQGGVWDEAIFGETAEPLHRVFMIARPSSIYGGASEVQRDIIARALLGKGA